MSKKTPILKYRPGDPLETAVRQTADRVPRETEEVEFLEKTASPFPIERLKEELQGRIIKDHGIHNRSEDIHVRCVSSVLIGELKEVLAIIQRLETESQ